MCIQKIVNWFKNLGKGKVEAEIREEKPKGWGRLINTWRGEPNAPKRHTCPSCYSRARRKAKTVMGPQYHCHCGAFFTVTWPPAMRRALTGQ